LTGAHGAFCDSLGIVRVLQCLLRTQPTWQGDRSPLARLLAQVGSRVGDDVVVTNSVVGQDLSTGMAGLSIGDDATVASNRTQTPDDLTNTVEGDAQLEPVAERDVPNLRMCFCMCAAVKFIVKRRTSVNIGRSFWCCPQDRNQQCGFFEWDQVQMTSSTTSTMAAMEPPQQNACLLSCLCGQVPALRTVLRDTPNKGRQFYNCAKARGLQCNFFQWETAGQQQAHEAPSSPLHVKGGAIEEEDVFSTPRAFPPGSTVRLENGSAVPLLSDTQWKRMIEEFMGSDQDSLDLPPQLTTQQRHAAHELCAQLGLKHESVGKGMQRSLHISRTCTPSPSHSAQQRCRLREDLLHCQQQHASEQHAPL